MTALQSIELLLDPAAEEQVTASWRALADAGLPSQAAHTGATNRPHVTVAVAEHGFADGTAARVSAVFAGWDLATRGLAAEIGAPLLFGGEKERWVLVRQIVPSRRLLAMHEAVHRAIRDPDRVVDRTRPDRWTPHVTLARRMPGARLGEATAALDATPVECRLVSARLWDSATKTVMPLASAG